MSIGSVLGLLAVGLAFGAAAIRNRDAVWAVVSLLALGVLGYDLARYGIAARLISSPDGLLVVFGLIVFAVVIGLTQALPASRMTRLVYGPTYPEWAFEQQLVEARQPFIDAAQAGDASVEEKAAWLRRMAAEPPTHEWAGLRDRLADGDEEWARLAAAGTPADTPSDPPSDEWLAWKARTDRMMADWADLRSRFRERGFARVRVGQRVAVGALVLAAVLSVGGSFHIVALLTSGPPAGRAAVVPDQPPNRSVYLAPLGDFPSGRLEGLVGFYRTRYDLAAEVLPPAPIPESARDATRGQLVAEDVIDTLRTAYTEASNTDAVVIAVTSEDLYIRSRPDWGWAFGLRDDGHLAVVSTARMEAAPGLVGDRLEDSRLRKMVTKNIGVLYFGLDQSPDPTSVLFDNILSVDDLDAMGEDF